MKEEMYKIGQAVYCKVTGEKTKIEGIEITSENKIFYKVCAGGEIRMLPGEHLFRSYEEALRERRETLRNYLITTEKLINEIDEYLAQLPEVKEYD